MMTKRALDEMGAGVLRVLVTQEVQSRNVSQLAAAAGLKAEIEELDGYYRVTVYKTTAPTLPPKPQARPQPEKAVSARPHSVTLFFGSDTVGRGDDELGRLLARLMLQALADMDNPPARIVFMNTGVRLVCKGSPAIEALKALEHKGTKILACGTCLDYLGLVDDVEVGTVSNMLDIIEALMGSENVLAV